MNRWIIGLAVVLFSCSEKQKEKEDSPELYRPQFHFSPAKNWTNDPNGLVYFDGEYHLFFQYNPYGTQWGHMSWGHAVSTDLLTWKELPVAIEEYIDNDGDSVMIFSGSAVVSHDTLVAIYTAHKSTLQNQAIAYSVDRGRTFQRYANNPVLDIGRKDFRDPKVFWYEPAKKWIMAVVVPDQHKVQFHESANLKKWKLLSEFSGIGDTTKIWECPDLFQLNDRWVLIISNSHPQGGPFVGMQYFIGDFDGTKFTAENPSQYPLYLDHGKDFYAGVTFNNEPEGRRIMIGWVNNWAYAGAIPTSAWRGAMSFPRELSLYASDDGLRLMQTPLTKLQPRRVEISPTDKIQLPNGVVIGYNEQEKSVYFDRTKAGVTSFSKNFPSIEKAPARLIDGKVSLLIYVDQSIVEVFINDGEAVITQQVF